MIEKVFTEGCTIDCTFDGPNVFTRQEMGGMLTETSQGVQKYEFVASQGRSKAKCEALFLPYMPRAINYAASNGLDVISGPFSGCWMAAYFNGGARRVCHVATPECNAAWNTLKQQLGSALGMEFKPANFLQNVPAFKKKLKMGAFYVLGVITAHHKCYSILMVDVGTMKTGKLTLGRRGFSRKYETAHPEMKGHYKVLKVWKV